MVVNESINAEIEQPDEYQTWIEIANTKLNQIDNLNIEVKKVDNVSTLTITKKDGTTNSVEILDGEKGEKGDCNFATFDIGNEKMEKNFPYYHILQEAPTIRKAYKATVKSRGSEYGKSPFEIDYERVYWNGKTFTKEYAKNVRGSRVNLSKTQMHLNGQFINEGSNQYLNMHYKYLDRIADEVANALASEFNLKLGRKQDTGLIEEFAMQEGITVENVLAAFESFM